MDPMQIAMTLVIINYMALAIVDSGAYKIVMHNLVMQQYGLTVHKLVAGIYTKFKFPSSGVEHDYVVMVENSFDLRVRDTFRFVLSGLEVVEVLFPFFIQVLMSSVWGV